MENIYSIPVKTIEGKDSTLKLYQSQVLLIVNVASRCGLTPQYEGLEKLYRQFKPLGFSVLGFPCNQFAHQEPANEEEIKNFCTLKYNITFPMFSKIDVNGPNTHPIYSYLKSHQKGTSGPEPIKWNFGKFLIDRTGQVSEYFAPPITPDQLTHSIEKLFK